MKKLFFITLCTIVAVVLCSCEKSPESHNVAFIMSVELKKIPIDGFYNCKINSDRAKWAETKYTKSSMPITLEVDGGAATWNDRYYTISFEYRQTQEEAPIKLCMTKTPTLAELENCQGEKFPHEIAYVEETEIGQLIYALHYIYK